MPTLGSLAFAAPWALTALVLLPAIWWLLRLTPPSPRRIRFPAVGLLMRLTSREESAAKSPIWLLFLRMALAIAVILGAAHPLIDAPTDLRGGGPVVLFIDDGWAAARVWPQRLETMESLLDRVERADRPVAVATTALRPLGALKGGAGPPVWRGTAAAARRLVLALEPKPWPTDRSAAVRALAASTDPSEGAPGHVFWISDGLAEGDTEAVLADLRRFGAVSVVAEPPERAARVLKPPTIDGERLTISALRPQSVTRTAASLIAVDEAGYVLARKSLVFEPGEREARVSLELPNELRNRLGRLEIEGGGTAATLVLMDERWRRRPVGLVSAGGAGADQPLMGDLYYLERALKPFTDVREGTVGQLLKRKIAVLVLADQGRLEAGDRGLLAGWVDRGGVLVWFAGPRLAQHPEIAEVDAAGPTLLPVGLRRGARIMGGSMSWRRPARLAAFDAKSPFFGLTIPAEVTVKRQVLAQPSLDLAEKTWARLNDGTPLVTGVRRGTGWSVLIHTTANAQWSNLPLSGLFVEMLQRLVELSQGAVPATGAAPLKPIEIMDGFGRLGPSLGNALPIRGREFATTPASPEHPPGYYGAGPTRRALNLSATLPPPSALGPLPAWVERATYGAGPEIDLRPWLLGLALALLLADLVVSLALRGLIRPPSRRALGMATLVAVAAVPMPAAAGSDAFALAASNRTRLAYVITGDARTDEISRTGLHGLGVVVRRRTAAELGEPIGVDLETDELAFFPLLYWPIADAASPLSTTTAARVNEYLRNGGTILFDTAGVEGRVNILALRQLARALNIPPLIPVPPDHVLTRAFYLLQEFPGRWTGGTLWVERAGDRVNDGVSPVIAGGHDWASAWALDDREQPLFPVVPGGERQREMAFRFGINLVMYTLTGNYKADQVHLPAILDRLGR